jgi:glucose/arabinose dehydrogenase
MRWMRSTTPRLSRARRQRKCSLTVQLHGVQALEDRLPLTVVLPGFSDVPIVSGISLPTAMEFSPDGRLWVLEQTGAVKLVRNDGTTFTALTQTVDASGERGMLGIAFDPNFATNHYVYLYYTNPNAGTASWATTVHNQVSRFTVNDTNTLQPLFQNEAPILDLNNLISATNHNGGAIHFGTDGMLYVNTGDNVQTFTQGSNTYRVSQTMTNMLGKQLRMDVSRFNSGAATRNDIDVGDLIPSNNPFANNAAVTGINKLIYVLGLRNPYTFAVQPGTGRILINDVGETTWEEINDSIAGSNYGWSGGSTDGFGQTPPGLGTYRDPLLAYAHSGTGSLATGVAVVGSTFYNPATVQFPASYVGKYFYQDLNSAWIRYFDPNSQNASGTPDGNSVQFASSTPGGLRDLKVDSAGNLYYLAGSGGVIRRISYTPAAVVGRRLFYNNSAYDGNSAAANGADDAAIATDKTAYLPGSGTSTFSAVSSYSRGINGIMVDLSGAHGAITANSFIFKVGNNNSPNSWATVTATATVTVRAGAGANGSDRIEILWADGAIQNTWLEVVAKGNDTLGGLNTSLGLATSSVFFFGSAPADSGAANTSGFQVTSGDEVSARSDPHGPGNLASISNVNDFNRDRMVNSSDQITARNSTTTISNQLKFLVVGAGGPFSPESPAAAASVAAPPPDESGRSDGAVASALAERSAAARTPATTGASPDHRVARLRSEAAVAAYLRDLADRGGESSEGQQDEGADDPPFHLDDELLGCLAARL